MIKMNFKELTFKPSAGWHETLDSLIEVLSSKF
jgi:hypothetical protein